ncbi:MAG: hypothetical protein ABR600_07910 [Actinomycetota bacterium]
MDPGADVDELRARVAARSWYHTIELAPGVETRGFFDLRSVAPLVLPRSLTGRRCLDVGTFDGFWSIEMLRRGAEEVVAIDVLDPRRWDWPAGSDDEVVAAIGERLGSGEGFAIVMQALGREVERRDLSVYDLDPDQTGRFDFVYLGSLLLHLRDPVLGLERVREVCSGEVTVVDTIDPVLTAMHPRLPLATLDGIGRPWWWRANAAGLVRMVRSAGFEVLGTPRRVTFPRGPGQPVPPLSFSQLRSRAGRTALRTARLGDPQLAIRARPSS